MHVCKHVTHTHACTRAYTHTWRELGLYRALIHAWALIYTYMTLHQDYIEHWITHTYMPADWVYIEYDTYIHDGRLRLYRALIHTYMICMWTIDSYQKLRMPMIKYFNGYNKVNDPSYLSECHYPCDRMLQMLRVHCDTMRLLNVGRTSNLQCGKSILEFSTCLLM